MIALGMLVGGLLYLGQYEDGLIEAELDALKTQGEIFAGAIGQGAVGTGADGSQSLLPEVSRQLLRRLTQPTRTRARLYDSNGFLVADSRFLMGQGGTVEVEVLPPPETGGGIRGFFESAYETLVTWLPARGDPPPYIERANQTAFDYPEVAKALSGGTGRNVRLTSDKAKVLIAALPVQRFKQVLGALMLTTGGSEIELAVRDVRFGILKVFAVALAVTVLLSFYLAGTIARPVRRLAEAADRVRGGQGGQGGRAAIPDFTRRRDEIGDLSVALRDMTGALWHRMEEIEKFAADVAHEIKNPLTSLRSAVETAARVTDPEQQRKLMSIIQQDVMRMDRLISDISNASRLDAELARAELASVDMGELLNALVQVRESKSEDDAPELTIDPVEPGACVVNGIEGSLVQVFQNLVGNALSFSPPGGNVRLAATRENGEIVITVDDCGPGIPPENLDSVFERFYTQRPESEAFGTHSGLGLSISRQIIEAHDGTIIATNRYENGDGSGAIIGARFEVRLPAS
jgi:two-component system sensor histidine kinase ChvG